MTYELFNCEEDFTTIQVGADEILTDEECDGADIVILRSSSCLDEERIGQATVAPCAGPIGTEHTIIIEMDSDQKHKVDRASIRLSSQTRQDDEYDLTPDSAKEGLFVIRIISVGTKNETREDSIQFKLWAEDPNGGEAE